MYCIITGDELKSKILCHSFCIVTVVFVVPFFMFVSVVENRIVNWKMTFC